LLAGWWLFVPLHELLHAGACVLAGGTVTRLEIAPEYGGALLARIFPFVAASGEYAGRLSGFDTAGSDWTYLATDLGPFVLTLFPGVWALRRAAKASRSIPFGFWLPFAWAPFLSLTGDAYEIGSILTTQLPAWSEPAVVQSVRGDDLFRILSELRRGADARLWLGTLCAFGLGVLWSAMTYALADRAARLLHEPLLTPITADRASASAHAPAPGSMHGPVRGPVEGPVP
jgi:hypothetical protein